MGKEIRCGACGKSVHHLFVALPHWPEGVSRHYLNCASVQKGDGRTSQRDRVERRVAEE